MKTASRLLALEGISALPRPHRRHRQRGRRLPDRIRRPPEHPAHQSRPRRPPAGHQHHPLRDLDLQPGRRRAGPLHSANASRTILSDKGGYTNVEGERCEAVRGDIIITPNGTWHDHGNDADAPVIWIDMLDWPLMEFLDLRLGRPGIPGAGAGSNAKSQKTVQPTAIPARFTATAACARPLCHTSAAGDTIPTPCFTIAAPTFARRSTACARKPAIRYEGIQMQFVNPVTGKPVFADLDYQAQLLRPGEETRPKRETCGTFMVVMDGNGYTEVGGRRFDWETNDIMVVPNFLWRRHVNTGNTDAVLYTVCDASLMKNIGQYRAQGQEPRRQRGPTGELMEL